MSVRSEAARVVARVVSEGASLDRALVEAEVPAVDHALLRECCYGCVRWHVLLEHWLRQLLHQPLPSNQTQLAALLRVGIYQLAWLRIPDYAAVSATVEAARELSLSWATGLVNGVLRHFMRQRETFLRDLDRDIGLALPSWWRKVLRRDWPEHWLALAKAQNAHPPLTLRVNAQRATRQALCDELAVFDPTLGTYAATALTLQNPCDPAMLPALREGRVSVQDEAAQLISEVLSPAPKARVLDACAAPGGKTGHLLEAQATLDVLALDIDAERLARVEHTLQRLGLSARCQVADAAMPEAWWDGTPFDAILLDAPCSGSGVIRRHPDIRLLRRRADIARLAARQQQLLMALWPLLRPGGRLLYVTCSWLREENEQVVAAVLAEQPTFLRAVSLDVPWGYAAGFGRQILPGEAGMDGFYLALIERTDVQR